MFNINSTHNNNTNTKDSDAIQLYNYYDDEWFVEDISEETSSPRFLSLNTYTDYDDASPCLFDDEDDDCEDVFLDEDNEPKIKLELASVIDNEFDTTLYETFNVLSKANEMVDLLLECYDTLENEDLKKNIKELLERPLNIRNKSFSVCGNCGNEMEVYDSTLKKDNGKKYYNCFCGNPIYTGKK